MHCPGIRIFSIYRKFVGLGRVNARMNLPRRSYKARSSDPVIPFARRDRSSLLATGVLPACSSTFRITESRDSSEALKAEGTRGEG